MKELYQEIVANLRNLMARILEPRLDLAEFLDFVAKAAKELDPEKLEARVYEVDFIENRLYLKTSTQVAVDRLPTEERTFTILPHTITGDAIIENRVIVASRSQGGYAGSRFREGEEVRAAFPIEFYDVEMPEGRTKYVLVVEKKGRETLAPKILQALKDYSALAGLAISIKELRDKLSRYYEENRNLVLTGQHSAALGHDIRSLNVGIGGYLTLALRIMEGGSVEEKSGDLLKYLTLARENAGHVEAMLKNLSQFTKNKINLNRDTDLALAVRAKAESLGRRLDFEKLLEFQVDLPQNPSGVLVDPDWFGTVVENLVKNSVEACGGRTRIEIKLERNSEKVLLTISDNCGGIPREMLTDIFTPFRSGTKWGQGLGLANAKKVVEEHGGGIKAYNRNGSSAVFEISFDVEVPVD